MQIEDYKMLLEATAQAAIEAHIMLQRFRSLHEYTVTVKMEKCGFDVTIDANHQVRVISRTVNG